jgi:hypothetical protein
MELIGTVVRMQVQRSRLKPGLATTRVYDPGPLLEVRELDLSPRGVVGDGVLDVHHADHPDSRNVKLLNGVSVMTVSRYRVLREQYGAHLVDGMAGESLLLDTEHLDDLSGALVLETDGGAIAFDSIPAPPCVEFSRFVIGRGYYLRTSSTGRIRAGARLYRGQPAQQAQAPPVRSG